MGMNDGTRARALARAGQTAGCLVSPDFARALSAAMVRNAALAAAARRLLSAEASPSSSSSASASSSSSAAAGLGSGAKGDTSPYCAHTLAFLLRRGGPTAKMLMVDMGLYVGGQQVCVPGQSPEYYAYTGVMRLLFELCSLPKSVAEDLSALLILDGYSDRRVEDVEWGGEGGEGWGAGGAEGEEEEEGGGGGGGGGAQRAAPARKSVG
jgi:hypothetical protein